MLGDKAQHLIAQGMTKAVVDALEMIDVDHRHRQHCPGRPRLGLRPLDGFHCAAAVEHPGQRIGDGLALGRRQLLGQRPRLGRRRRQLAGQPRIGGLHRCRRRTEPVEQCRQRALVERFGQCRAAVGQGPAIGRDIRLPGLNPVGQCVGLVVCRLD